MKVRYLLAGQDCNPVNRHGIFIEVNHDQGAIINQAKPHVSISNLYFALEDIINVMAQLENAPGITEGVPLDIEITEPGSSPEVLSMYLNLMEGFLRSNDGIEASVKMRDSLDHIEDQVDGFTLESMYNDTTTISFDVDGSRYNSFQEYFDKRCIFIPYVLSSIPNRQDAFQAIFSITYVVIELQKSIKFVIQWATPIPDGAGGAFAIGQLIAEIAFIALLLAALIVLILHLFKCLIQAIKYHGAMLVVDMLKIVCVKIGRKFQSSTWETFPYNQIAYLPEKYNPLQEVTSGSENVFGVAFAKMAKTGFQSPGYATGAFHDSGTATVQKGYMAGTGADVLRFAKTFINGKIIIPDQANTLLLERRDYSLLSPLYQLPNIRQDWNGYNTDELSANILIRFAEDLNDKNCIDKFIGTILQATHSQMITNDQRLALLKGVREILIGAARGIRKTDLNMIELIHLVLEIEYNKLQNIGIDQINNVIHIFNIAIKIINIFIAVWNALMSIIDAIISVIASIVAIVGGNGAGTFSGLGLSIVPITVISDVPKVPLIPASYGLRIDALLLENDMVTTPKVLLVDTLDNILTGRNAFTGAGGYSGQKRIAYLHPRNDEIINAQWLWNKFYSIDAFVGAINNRFTKISPETNHESDKNPVLMRLADFKNLVSNPKFNDNFGEEVVAETIQWYIEKNGAADIQFRKAGWLKDPQSNNGTIRSQEINVNLQIKTSLPNGQ